MLPGRVQAHKLQAEEFAVGSLKEFIESEPEVFAFVAAQGKKRQAGKAANQQRHHYELDGARIPESELVLKRGPFAQRSQAANPRGSGWTSSQCHAAGSLRTIEPLPDPDGDDHWLALPRGWKGDETRFFRVDPLIGGQAAELADETTIGEDLITG